MLSNFFLLRMSHSSLCLSLYKTLSVAGRGSPEWVALSECMLLIGAGHVKDGKAFPFDPCIDVDSVCRMPITALPTPPYVMS